MDGNEGDTVAYQYSTREGEQRGNLPSLATIEAVTTAKGVDPDTLPPLYDAVDPDALDDLLGDPRRDDVQVSFSYADCDVTVERGLVTVERQAKSGPAQLE